MPPVHAEKPVASTTHVPPNTPFLRRTRPALLGKSQPDSAELGPFSAFAARISSSAESGCEPPSRRPLGRAGHRRAVAGKPSVEGPDGGGRGGQDLTGGDGGQDGLDLGGQKTVGARADDVGADQLDDGAGAGRRFQRRSQ